MKNLLNVSEIKVECKPKFKLSECPTVSKLNDAYDVLIQVWDKYLMSILDVFKIILLNKENRVLGVVDITMGGKDFVPVERKDIFSIAIKASASKIILAHNYPFEKLVASSRDIALTKKAVERRKLLYIEICNHLLIS